MHISPQCLGSTLSFEKHEHGLTPVWQRDPASRQSYKVSKLSPSEAVSTEGHRAGWLGRRNNFFRMHHLWFSKEVGGWFPVAPHLVGWVHRPLSLWALPQETGQRLWVLVHVWNFITIPAASKFQVTLGKWRQHKSCVVKTTGSGTRLSLTLCDHGQRI